MQEVTQLGEAPVRVGILIPTYNSQETIAQTLESIATQDAGLPADIRIYVADDASADQTLHTIRRTWRHAEQLCIVESPHNQGERANVNQALQRIGSDLDWVVILHSDDLAKSDWLRCMLEAIRESTTGVASICSSWDTLQADGAILPGEDSPLRARELIPGSRVAVRNTLLRGCWWHLSGCAIRVRALNELGGFRVNLPQLGDWDFLIRLLDRGWCVTYIPRTLIVYRQHEQSVSAESFKLDRDLHESLSIAAEFQSFLSPTDVLRFHGTRLLAACRRLGRALLRRNIRKAEQHVRTLLQILRSLGGILASRAGLVLQVRRS